MIYKGPETEKICDDAKYTVCPCCGETVHHGKFCTNCGAPLPKEPVSVPLPKQSEQSEISEGPQPVDDSGLTLLGDFCKKTVATVGGDGYDEIVLYENGADGSFQIHTYSKYAYMQKENHHSFKAKDGAYTALLKLAEKLRLDEYEGKSGTGLCGGMYICKYRKDGVIHRVTTDNLGTDGPEIIIRVGNLLGSFKGEEITLQD